MSEKLKVVIDTQIFLRSLINLKSASMKIRPRNWPAQYILCVSDEIEAEVIDVLNRPHLRTKFPQITDGLVVEVANELKNAYRVVVDKVESISRDPKDDIFLA